MKFIKQNLSQYLSKHAVQSSQCNERFWCKCRARFRIHRICQTMSRRWCYTYSKVSRAPSETYLLSFDRGKQLNHKQKCHAIGRNYHRNVPFQPAHCACQWTKITWSGPPESPWPSRIYTNIFNYSRILFVCFSQLRWEPLHYMYPSRQPYCPHKIVIPEHLDPWSDDSDVSWFYHRIKWNRFA